MHSSADSEDNGLDAWIEAYQSDPTLFENETTQSLCTHNLTKEQRKRLCEIAIEYGSERVAQLAFHAINTENSKKIIKEILERCPEALNIIIVDDDKIHAQRTDGSEDPVEAPLIDWIIFHLKNDKLCKDAIEKYLNLETDLTPEEKKRRLLFYTIQAHETKQIERILDALNPEEDPIELLTKDDEIDNNELAYFVYATIRTPFKTKIINSLLDKHLDILDININERPLFEWLLFNADDNDTHARIITTYFAESPISKIKFNKLLLATLIEQDIKTTHALLKLQPINWSEETITETINDNIWYQLRQICADYKKLISLSKDEMALGWSNLDIEDRLPKSSLKNLPDLAIIIPLLIYHGCPLPKDITNLFKKLKEAAKARDSESLSDWADDNPIDKFKEVENTCNILVKLDQINQDLQKLIESGNYPDLDRERTNIVLSELRQASAKKLFNALKSLAESTPGNKGIDYEMPSTPLNETLFREAIINSFINKTIINYQDWSIISNLLHFKKPDDLEINLNHRVHSGPHKEIWDKASNQQKYICAIKDNDNIYRFYALPLLDEAGETSEAEKIKKIELALLSSLFYHLNREGSHWNDPTCNELKKLICHINKALKFTSTQDLFANRHEDLEKEEYYDECPSDDSEEEEVEKFQRQPLAVRNTLLSFAKKMMEYGQVDKIWTADKKKLHDPIGSKKVTFYDITARAEIHHDGAIPPSVQNDLNLLNEHALTDILSEDSLKEIRTKFVIAQYRGIHYNTSTWSQKQRKSERKDLSLKTTYAPMIPQKASIKDGDTPEMTEEKIAVPVKKSLEGSSSKGLSEKSSRKPFRSKDSIELPGRVVDVPGDGNCFFHAVAHELSRQKITLTYVELRARAIAYLETHPGLLNDPIELNDRAVTRGEYIAEMRKDKTYVEGPIIDALAQAFNVHLSVSELRVNEAGEVALYPLHINDHGAGRRATIGLIRQGQHYKALELADEHTIVNFCKLFLEGSRRTEPSRDFSAGAAEEKINRATQLLHHQLICLNHTGTITSNLSSDDYPFLQAAHAIQDFYTKDYDSHEKKRALITKFKEKRTPITNAIDAALLFVKNAENYNNSTGDTPYHACRYAYGLKEYGTGKGKRLRPKWRNNGKAQRPYSGEIGSFLFDLESYLKLKPLHLVSLDHKKMVNIDALKIAERETAFHAYIPKENMIERRIARYPNFNKPYKPYYQYQCGMSKELYERFQSDLRTSKPHSKENKRIKLLIGEHLCAYQEACLIENARQEAKNNDAWLIYRDRTGGFSFVPPPLKPAARGDGAEAGSVTRNRQERLMEKRKELEPGWLEKKLQHYRIIPGNNYREALETLCADKKDNFDTALASSSHSIPEAEWLIFFKDEVKSSLLSNKIAKKEFQQTIDAILHIAQHCHVSISIESFLFNKPITLNLDVDQKIFLIYLGGDGFHALTPRIIIPAPTAMTNTTAAAGGAGTSAEELETEEAPRSMLTATAEPKAAGGARKDDMSVDTSATDTTPFRSAMNQTTPASTGIKRGRSTKETKPPPNSLTHYFASTTTPSSLAKRSKADEANAEPS